jgi:hypothetical protein
MRFGVPKIKDNEFSLQLFKFILDSIDELYLESGKLPDRVTLSGPLGKELHLFICEKGWDLKKFGICLSNALNDSIIFDYSKPIDQVEDRGGAIMDEGLNCKKVNGIPGPETIKKIISTYAQPAFKIERKIRPKIEVRLYRK